MSWFRRINLHYLGILWTIRDFITTNQKVAPGTWACWYDFVAFAQAEPQNCTVHEQIWRHSFVFYGSSWSKQIKPLRSPELHFKSMLIVLLTSRIFHSTHPSTFLVMSTWGRWLSISSRKKFQFFSPTWPDEERILVFLKDKTKFYAKKWVFIKTVDVRLLGICNIIFNSTLVFIKTPFFHDSEEMWLVYIVLHLKRLNRLIINTSMLSHS